MLYLEDGEPQEPEISEYHSGDESVSAVSGAYAKIRILTPQKSIASP